MSLVQIKYVPFVFEGRAAGVEIRAGDPDPLRLGDKFGPAAMKRRINQMMETLETLLKLYIQYQFESSGLGYSRLSGDLGLVGGSLEEWAPLKASTVLHRERPYGYYKGLPGGGTDPRVWSGRGLIVAQQAIQASQNVVEVNVRDAILVLNEATRPLFVLEEIARLAKGVAVKVFKAITGDKVHVYEEDTFNLRVGEAQPFDWGRGKGRPPMSGTERLLGDIKKGLGL